MKGALTKHASIGIRLTALACAFAISAFAAGDGTWLAKIPAKDHDRQNPYHGQDEAIAAGRRIFLDHCAQCHGEDANGTRKRPPLRSERVQQQASEGDIHWLLINGNMKKGMPSWAKLPDQQLWQIITYVRSLGATTQPQDGGQK
jgi:mono/diheme cytochrome c family protein